MKYYLWRSDSVLTSRGALTIVRVAVGADHLLEAGGQLPRPHQRHAYQHPHPSWEPQCEYVTDFIYIYFVVFVFQRVF